MALLPHSPNHPLRCVLQRTLPPKLRLLVSGSALIALLTAASPGSAQSPDSAFNTAQNTIRGYANGVGSVREAMTRAKRPERSAEQRLADADLLIRARDYDRAATVLNQIIEKHAANRTVHAEALFLLGETYFLSEQYPSAQRIYTRIADQGRAGRLAAYRPKALARLADIAIRRGDQRAIDDVYQRLGGTPTGSGGPILAYARGRILLAKNDSVGARASLQTVTPGTSYHHQATYLLGVVFLRNAQAAISQLPEAEQKNPQALAPHYSGTIEAFRVVTKLPPDTANHRHVIDLAWLAVGRLLCETGQLSGAVEAFNRVGRQSPEFGTALFESAAVHAELGDALRAQRALEVLAIIDPDGSKSAEAGLLRGDLELRTKQFDKAIVTFDGVRSQFEPMHERVARFLASTSDPAVFYDRLIEDQLSGSDEAEQVPQLAIRWAREADQGDEAFAVVNEVVRTRTLLRQSDEIVQQINAVMQSPARSKAFPDLRAGQQTAVGAINGLMIARVGLARALDSQESSSLSGEIAEVQRKRRTLQDRVLALPTSQSDFQARENAAENRWNKASQKIHQLQIQADTLQSVVNALRRVLRDSASRGVAPDPAMLSRFNEELTAHERDIAAYRETIALLRKQADQGRVASGFDDNAVFADGTVRAEYKRLLAAEVTLASRGAAGSNAAAYAKRITPLLLLADDVERRYEAILAEINRTVDARANELLLAIATEEAKLVGYAAQLRAMDQEARLVVGEVAMRNFGIVAERLRGIVMRADVGITEQAWEAREEQLNRVRRLQSERAQSERLLNEELQEVLDDTMGE